MFDFIYLNQLIKLIRVSFSQERLIWTQPFLNLTRLFDLQTMTVHTLRSENNPSSNSLVLVDSSTDEFLFYDRISGNLSGRYTDEVNGVRLKNSTRPLRSGVKDLVVMKLLERDPLAEHDIQGEFLEKELLFNSKKCSEEQRQCKALGCQHFCLQSFEERKCACADGFESGDNRICELPKKRVMMLNADNNFFWTSIDSNARPMINVPISTNSTSLFFQPRYFALNDPRNAVYFLYSIKRRISKFSFTSLTPN